MRDFALQRNVISTHPCLFPPLPSYIYLPRYLLLLIMFILMVHLTEANAQFIETGLMTLPRCNQTATLLHNGKVLIVGGTDERPDTRNPNFLRSEIYDPSTGTFSFAGSLNVPRSGHTATLLDNGKVLIVGGTSIWSSENLGKIELYDPLSDTFSVVATLGYERQFHTSTLLPNGNVLIIGGNPSSVTHDIDMQKSVLIFNPQTNSLTNGGVHKGRFGHSAVRLNNGKILIVGGLRTTTSGMTESAEKAELYDPHSMTFTEIGAPYYWTWPSGPATLLHDGRVLIGPSITGSVDGSDFRGPSRGVIFDPSTNTFSMTGNFVLNRSSDGTTSTLLASGIVLFTGGNSFPPNTYTKEAEVFDPASLTMSQVGNMAVIRRYHTATLLLDGRVLIVGNSWYRGGSTTSGRDMVARRAELYVPPATIPVAPSNLQATTLSSSSIALQWRDNSNNESGFTVEQATGSGTFLPLGTVGINQVTATNTDLAAATTYRYRVRSFNSAGNSAYSNIASATTLGASAQVTRFTNNTSYFLISLIVDGTQHIPTADMSIAPGAYREINLPQGQHSYIVDNGFWDGVNPYLMYKWSGNFIQPSGTNVITFNDPTIYQVLTVFNASGSALWSGTYWDNIGMPHTMAYRFTIDGRWIRYVDNESIENGSYFLIRRDPSTFTLTFSVGIYEGTYYEIGSHFIMRNGPSYWPSIDYYYQGP